MKRLLLPYTHVGVAVFASVLGGVALAQPSAAHPPHVLLWGSKNVADAPGLTANVYKDPLGDRDRDGHRFTYVKRGEGKLKGVDAFRDLFHESPGHSARRIFEGYAIGAGLLTLPSGRLVLTFHAADPARVRAASDGHRPEMGIYDVYVMLSDDAGTTWTDSGARLMAPAAQSGTDYGAVEPSVFPLRDGRLWMLIRTQVGRLYESFSSDNGETWTTATATKLISSDSPEYRVRLADGRVVLFLNSCQHWDDPHGYAHGGRYVLHAAISNDDGQTWKGFREVVRARETAYTKGDHGTAYPKAVATEDGQIILGTGQAKENLAVVRIDPQWLEARSHRDDFSSGLGGWHVTPTGTRLEPGAAGGTLLLGEGAVETGAEAVWNFPAGVAGSLILRVTPTSSWRSGAIVLTDHFSPPGDTRVAAGAIASLRLSEADVAPLGGGTQDWRIEWDAAGRQCTLIAKGRSHPFTMHRADTLGASYIRLQTMSDDGSATLRVHSITAEVR